MVGAEDNVIAAVHGNTGTLRLRIFNLNNSFSYCISFVCFCLLAIYAQLLILSFSGNLLYRQILEESGKLLHYSTFKDRSTIAVSYIPSETVVKIRTFSIPTGILVDEWAIHADASDAIVDTKTSKLYLIHRTLSDITISSYALLTPEATSDSESSPSSTSRVRLLSTQSVKAGSSYSHCLPVHPYYICAHKNSLTVLNIIDFSISTHKADEEEILELISGQPGDLKAISVGGKGFTKVYLILQNSAAGPELLPLIHKPTAGLSLSQFMQDDTPKLVLSSKGQSNTVKATVYSSKGTVEQEFTIASPYIPIDSFAVTQLYPGSSNSWVYTGVTQDDVFFGSKADASATDYKISIAWSRQEALSSILAAEMVDYPSDGGPTRNPYSSSGPLDIFSMFFKRVKYELEALISAGSIGRLYASAEDRFGLRKVLVCLTSVGKVIGMDSTSGTVLYTFTIPSFSTFAGKEAFLLIQRPEKYTPLKPMASVVFKLKNAEETGVFAFNPVEGKPLDDMKIFPPVLQTQLMHSAHEDTDYVKPILMLGKDLKVRYYPKLGAEHEGQSVYFFLAAVSPPVLKGYEVKLKSGGEVLNAKFLWDMSLGGESTEIIGIHAKVTGERIHSQGRVLPDRSVSYKYMNPNLVVIVTMEPEQGNINLFFVDAVSGKVKTYIFIRMLIGSIGSVDRITLQSESDKNIQ